MEIKRCKPAGKTEGWYDAAGTRYYHPQELQQIVEALLTAHEPKCTYPGAGDPPCLWDVGELCDVHHERESCQWWTICNCEACNLAQEIR